MTLKTRYDTLPLWSRRLPSLLREAVELYRADGRKFEAFDGSALDDAFVKAFAAYALKQDDIRRARRVNEITAEYVIRGHAAPIELALKKNGYELHTIIGGPRDAAEERAIAKLPAVMLAMGHVVWIPQVGDEVCP